MKLAQPALVVAALAAFATPAIAQDTAPAAISKQTPSPLLKKLMAAGEAERSAALMAFVEDQIATNAVYAGQYSALKKLDWDAVAMLGKWMTEAPTEAENGEMFRSACIHAIRDLVEGDASADLKKACLELAKDPLESRRLRTAAAYALAQFGDKSLVEKSIEQATAMTEADAAGQQAQGWSQLADIHYNLRDYDQAAAAYQKLIGIVESGKVPGGQGMPTVYYNCGCSMALAGKTEAALAMVEKALEHGKKSGQQLNRRLLETDMDIASLRGHEKFAALVKQYYGGAEKKD